MSDPESNTTVLDRIDARGRAAAAGLRGAVATMPVPDAPVRARPQWLRPALAMAGVLALVAGMVAVLVALANRPADVADRGGADTRWVLDSPPDGFVVAGAAGPGEGVSGDTSFLNRVDVYTDVSDPTGGAVFVDSTDAVEDLAGDPVDLGSVDGVLGSSPSFPDARAVQFGAGSERRTVFGRGISDELLVAVATEVAAGRPVLAALPDGFAEYLDISLLDAGAMAGVVAARGDELPAGLSTVGYTRPDDDNALVYLAVQPGSQRSQAALAALLAVTGPVDGLPNGRVIRIGDELQGVVWESGGLLFAVVGTEPVEVLVAAARTARPAGDAEWQRLVGMLPANPSGDGGTVEVTAPATTISADRSPWSGEVGGRPWEVRLGATDADVVEVLLDGDVIFTDRRDEEVWLRVFDNGDITAVYAIVPEGFPGSLEVTTRSGGSSSGPLPAEGSGRRLAAQVVPSSEFVATDWRNDNGEVLFDSTSSVVAFQRGAGDSWQVAVVAVSSTDERTVSVVHGTGVSTMSIPSGDEAGVVLIDVADAGTPAVVATAPDEGWTMVIHLLNGAVERDLVVPTASGGGPIAAAFVAGDQIAYVDLIDPTRAVVQRHLCTQPPADGTVPCQ